MMVRFDDAPVGGGFCCVDTRTSGRPSRSRYQTILFTCASASRTVTLSRSTTVSGMTVVLAVRIMDQADAGQILVSESVCASLTHRYDFSPAIPMELKGFPEPVDVYELVGTS